MTPLRLLMAAALVLSTSARGRPDSSILRIGAVGGLEDLDLAIRYGYQRFRPDIMLSTVVMVIVQTFQFTATAWCGNSIIASQTHVKSISQNIPSIGSGGSNGDGVAGTRRFCYNTAAVAIRLFAGPSSGRPVERPVRPQSSVLSEPQ